MKIAVHKTLKADIILIGGLLLAGAAVLLFLLLSPSNGRYVQVKADGSVIARYPLDKNITVPINTGGGKNIMEIQDGQVFVSEADCPDGLCVNTGKISKTGQTIICLPHKLVIEITDSETSVSDDIDIMVK